MPLGPVASNELVGCGFMTDWWSWWRAAPVDTGVCEYAPDGGAAVLMS